MSRIKKAFEKVEREIRTIDMSISERDSATEREEMSLELSHKMKMMLEEHFSRVESFVRTESEKLREEIRTKAEKAYVEERLSEMTEEVSEGILSLNAPIKQLQKRMEKPISYKPSKGFFSRLADYLSGN